ncbi:GSCFA domain-containing protein [Roseospira navarrensis]|uniref:GSCFA domain-containing protein n=1 Tax=Roseospira navarrensis TaxID=140058 RepID=A0A7X1ZFS1_9PROT|nr:GSCFA domain-containing protein [Roseospira navarrensis]MQX36587.1 hypothetical protein [Roseospira navarrensis]
MPPITKATLKQQIADLCFPPVLDGETEARSRETLDLATAGPAIAKGATEGSRAFYNTDLMALLSLIMGSRENDGTYHWALAQLFIFLAQVHDPRHDLLERLAEHWAWCLEDADTPTRQTLEGAGLGSDTLEQVRHYAKKVRRARSTLYPRARQQTNSRTYLTAALGLDADGHGQAPDPIPEDATFVVLGTCFARNIHTAFQDRGIASHHVALAEENPAEAQFAALAARQDTARLIRTGTPCVILTLGFAETRPIDGEQRRSGRLSRFSTPEHVADRIVQGVRALRALNPAVRIFITVSPVPLEGTASAFSVFEANAVSKSIVRYAVALAGEEEPGFTYFPSYEIVTQIAPALGLSGFGGDDGHPRHVDKALVAFICGLFLETYCPWAA